MDTKYESAPLNIHRVLSSSEPEFGALLRIYEESISERERKSVARLRGMIERPEYFFLTASKEASVAGFSISICLVDSDAAVLEYMAVHEKQRNQGIGGRLFKKTVEIQPTSERYVLIEVDSDKVPSADHADRVRRKMFYRRLGCREIEGLAYLMPPVSGSTPTPMEMLVYQNHLPDSIEKARLRSWLENCYSQVYQVARDDGRIDSMLARLPDHVKLI